MWIQRRSFSTDLLSTVTLWGPQLNQTATDHNTAIRLLVHWPLTVQRGGAWAGCGPAQSLLVVPNVTAYPSTASIPTSYYSMGHNFALNSKGSNDASHMVHEIVSKADLHCIEGHPVFKKNNRALLRNSLALLFWRKKQPVMLGAETSSRAPVQTISTWPI